MKRSFFQIVWFCGLLCFLTYAPLATRNPAAPRARPSDAIVANYRKMIVLMDGAGEVTEQPNGKYSETPWRSPRTGTACAGNRN